MGKSLVYVLLFLYVPRSSIIPHHLGLVNGTSQISFEIGILAESGGDLEARKSKMGGNFRRFGGLCPKRLPMTEMEFGETEKGRIPLPYPAAGIAAENVNAARDHRSRKSPKNSVNLRFSRKRKFAELTKCAK